MKSYSTNFLLIFGCLLLVNSKVLVQASLKGKIADLNKENIENMALDTDEADLESSSDEILQLLNEFKAEEAIDLNNNRKRYVIDELAYNHWKDCLYRDVKRFNPQIRMGKRHNFGSKIRAG